MPRIDFTNVGAASEYAPLPEGDYRCQLSDIELDRTRSGDERWKLRWTVLEGAHAGRLIFDSLVFTPKALPRVKLLCDCIAVAVDGVVDLEPVMLVDKQAVVSVYQDEYTSDQGQTRVSNKVPFDGYAPVPVGGFQPPF